MTRLFAIFSVTTVASAAVVAAAATGAFSSSDSAANIARPKAVAASPAGFGEDPRSPADLRQDALDALREKRDKGELPRENPAPEEAPAFLQGPDIQPPVFADSPEAPAPANVPAPVTNTPFVPAAPGAPADAAQALSPQPTSGLSPARIKEIVDIRIHNDPYRAPSGPSVQTDPFSGTTIINTSPNR
jgi:hypothetical protein